MSDKLRDKWKEAMRDLSIEPDRPSGGHDRRPGAEPHFPARPEFHPASPEHPPGTDATASEERGYEMGREDERAIEEEKS